MCAGFDAATWWKLAGQLGATWYYAAPTMHHAILASIPEGTIATRDTRIRMICNAAGGLLPSLAVKLKETFGASCAVLPSYGMTEWCVFLRPSFFLTDPRTLAACPSLLRPPTIDLTARDALA